MKEAALLLELPASRAARWLALRWLDEAATAHAALDAPRGLHDFRVGLRRLRATLDGYRAELGRAARRRTRRRLRDLAADTGLARDLEVQLAWVQRRRGRVRGAEQAGLEWLAERLRARLPEAEAGLRRGADAFPGVRRRLERRLRRDRREVTLADPRGGPPFRTVLAGHLAAAADALEEAMGAVAGVADQDAAHRARVAAKRVRYLVEPVAGAAPGAEEAARQLHALQDALGEMHDLHLLWTSCQDGAHEVQALRERVERERAASFRRLSRRWLGRAGDPLLRQVREVAAALGGAGPDREVERKFLLRRVPALTGLEVQAYRLDQGYLPGERLVERVRRVRGPQGERFFRTVKVGRGMTRTEVEEECSAELFRALWRLTRGRRVSKIRYRVPAGDLVWEIDRFRGRRLALAEVELPAEDTPVPIPAWLQPVLEREVTGEAEYVNQNLAR